jgi:ureidoglycolate lyase
MDLQPELLTPEMFEEFGEVIEIENARKIPINQGLTTRYHDLCNIDTSDQGGRAIVSVFRTSPLALPHQVRVMERHPLGSQGFIPTAEVPFYVLVGRDNRPMTAEDLTLFVTNGHQGVNIYKNTWHHFQIVLNHTQDFIVIDRGGAGENLEEIDVDGEVWITEPCL